MSPTRKSGPKTKYSKSQLLSALTAIKDEGLSYSKASVKFNIPKTTLADKLKGRYNPNKNKPGPDTALTTSQEIRIISWLKNSRAIGYGRTKTQLADEIKSLLDQIEPIDLNEPRIRNVFKDNRPSSGWIKRFLNRHKNEISARTPEHLGHRKAEISELDIRNWFDELKSYLLDEHNIIAENFLSSENSSRIFNMGEFGFFLAGGHREQKVWPSKESINVATDFVDTREQITVLASVSASGNFNTPFVIFPEEIPKINFNEVNINDFIVGSSPTGRVTSDVFFEYVTNNFYEEVKGKIEFPIIVFIDSHSSQLNLQLSEFLIKKNIIVYCFPPHCNHIIQPLDISVFGQLKKYYHDSLAEFSLISPVVLSKSNFLLVFSTAWQKTKENCLSRNAFIKCGIMPYDPDTLDYDQLVYHRPSITKHNRKPPFTESQGLIRARNILEKFLPNENVKLFRSLLKGSQHLEKNTISVDLQCVWQAYKGITEAAESMDTINEDSKQSVGGLEACENHIKHVMMGSPIDENMEEENGNFEALYNDQLNIANNEELPSITFENNVEFENYSQLPCQELLKPLQNFSNTKLSKRKNYEEYLTNVGETMVKDKKLLVIVGIEDEIEDAGMEVKNETYDVEFREGLSQYHGSEVKCSSFENNIKTEVILDEESMVSSICDKKSSVIEEPISCRSSCSIHDIENMDQVKDETSFQHTSKHSNGEENNLIELEQSNLGVNEATFKCNECENSFSLKCYLSSHQKLIHKKRKKLKCNECDNLFGCESDVTHHITTVHSKIKLFKCNDCDNSFSRKSYLNSHIDVVHKKLNPWKCVVCGSCFSKKISLELHISSVHKDPLIFACKECEYTFSSKLKLGHHINAVHKKLKLWKCVECNECFGWKGTLKNHILAKHNNGVKPYSCTDCDKCFSLKNLLANHYKIVHEKVKPFKCKDCNRCFFKQSLLSTHINSVHKNLKPWKCVECDSYFGWRSCLKKHILTMHKIEGNVLKVI